MTAESQSINEVQKLQGSGPMVVDSPLTSLASTPERLVSADSSHHIDELPSIRVATIFSQDGDLSAEPPPGLYYGDTTLVSEAASGITRGHECVQSLQRKDPEPRTYGKQPYPFSTRLESKD